MNNQFLEASRLKLRFSTTLGLLTTEQLWDLSLTKLAACIKAAKKTLQKDDNDNDLAFLDENKTVNKEDQLRFDILKEVYLTKKTELEAQRSITETKAHNEKIMALILQKKEASLGEKSLEELEAMLIK